MLEGIPDGLNTDHNVTLQQVAHPCRRKQEENGSKERHCDNSGILFVIHTVCH